MEDMLIVWLEDLMHKNVPFNALVIREQALYFYKYLKEKYDSEE